MLNSITLSGFKSFVQDEIDFGRLTLLTGLNSSGKSSIIQAIQMLSNVLEEKEVYLKGYGDFNELRNPYCKEMILTTNYHNGIEIYIQQEDNLVYTYLAPHISDKKFPQLIHIAADRFGPETSIPISFGINYTIGSKGENILKVINHYEDKELPKLLIHENSEGDTLGFNLEAWLGVISPNTKFSRKIQKYTDTSYATFNGHRAKNVGFGLSYTLPVITAVNYLNVKN